MKNYLRAPKHRYIIRALQTRQVIDNLINTSLRVDD